MLPKIERRHFSIKSDFARLDLNSHFAESTSIRRTSKALKNRISQACAAIFCVCVAHRTLPSSRDLPNYGSCGRKHRADTRRQSSRSRLRPNRRKRRDTRAITLTCAPSSRRREWFKRIKRISSYAPFPVTVCFNGHHFVARQLDKKRVGYEMRDNMFVAVSDEKRFRRAIAALTPRAIERFCNSWVYELTTWFPTRARRLGFRYRWFLDQVEYSHNLIFHKEDQLNALFGRLLDRGRQIGQPHVIARLFQRKRIHANRTGGRMQRTRQEDYVLKAWHKKTYIKQYNKQGTGPRTETTTHDVREFGIKKALHHLPYLLHCMENCNKRLKTRAKRPTRAWEPFMIGAELVELAVRSILPPQATQPAVEPSTSSRKSATGPTRRLPASSTVRHTRFVLGPTLQPI